MRGARALEDRKIAREDRNIVRYLGTINTSYRRVQCIEPPAKTTPTISSSQLELLFVLVHNIHR